MCPTDHFQTVLGVVHDRTWHRSQSKHSRWTLLKWSVYILDEFAKILGYSLMANVLFEFIYFAVCELLWRTFISYITKVRVEQQHENITFSLPSSGKTENTGTIPFRTFKPPFSILIAVCYTFNHLSIPFLFNSLFTISSKTALFWHRIWHNFLTGHWSCIGFNKFLSVIVLKSVIC